MNFEMNSITNKLIKINENLLLLYINVTWNAKKTLIIFEWKRLIKDNLN